MRASKLRICSEYSRQKRGDQYRAANRLDRKEKRQKELAERKMNSVK